MINFVCIYYGNKYSFPYVKNLHNMVERNLTTPHKFICFTDNTVIAQRKEFRRTNIEFRQFKRHDFNGWFNKLQLFSPDSNLDGNTLYMDLDVVIMKNIECFGYIGESKNFVGMNDFNPTTGLFNSSIMRFNNEYHSKLIWDEYLKRRSEFHSCTGDQEIVSKLIKGHKDTISFPDEWTQSYKWFDRKGLRYHSEKWTYEQDLNAKVCVFHGRPNPAESTQEWVKKLWK